MMPQRSLCYGISLPAYLADSAAVTASCFLNHWGNRCALVATGIRQPVPATPAAAAALASASRVW
jgi:hypothetical protein